MIGQAPPDAPRAIAEKPAGNLPWWRKPDAEPACWGWDNRWTLAYHPETWCFDETPETE